jgi:hypothetical protein
MTTIAWDGKTLAGDTLATGTFNRRVVKIWELRPGVYFGGCGLHSEVFEVKEWLRYEKREERPEVKECVGILIRNGKAYRIEENLMEVPIIEDFHAVGSGACFAITAMYLGCNAEQAVDIASKFDEATGGDIMTISVSGVNTTDLLKGAHAPKA